MAPAFAVGLGLLVPGKAAGQDVVIPGDQKQCPLAREGRARAAGQNGQTLVEPGI
jgi:hypothetical protein